jgi:hypothetical protein
MHDAATGLDVFLKELRLKEPLTGLAKGKLTVSVKDRQRKPTRIGRTFSFPPGTR